MGPNDLIDMLYLAFAAAYAGGVAAERTAALDLEAAWRNRPDPPARQAFGRAGEAPVPVRTRRILIPNEPWRLNRHARLAGGDRVKAWRLGKGRFDCQQVRSWGPRRERGWA